MKSKFARVLGIGIGVLAAGCVSDAVLTASKRPGEESAPSPGKRAFYEARIKGKYALDNGRLLPIRPAASAVRMPTGRIPPPLPGVIRSTSTLMSAYWLEGRVLEVVSNNLVVVGQAVTNISGAVTYPPTWRVTLDDSHPPPVDMTFRAVAVSSGTGLFRTVAEPTFDQYLEVYERESVLVPLEPLTSLARVSTSVNHPSLPPGVRRAVPTAPTGTVASATQAMPPLPISSVAVSPQVPVRAVPGGVAPRLPRRPAAPENGAPSTPFAVLVTNETVRIIKYRGPDAKVAILERIDGLPVVAILASAFDGCRGVTGVTIPATVTSIADSAFRNCPALESILVDVMNPVYSSSSDGVLFNMEKTRLLRYPPGKAGEYAVPQRTSEIGNYAFADCGRLTRVVIPETITRIREGAFYQCKWLGSVTIPPNITAIETSTFSGCSRLTRVTIPEGVTSIGHFAFARCSSLTSLTIPDHVTSIGNFVFRDCTSLTNISLGIGIRAFSYHLLENSTALVRITVAPANPSLSSVGGVLFDKNLATLIQYPSGKPEPNYAVPASVARIGSMAFAECNALVSLTMPASVTAIGGGAFFRCARLTHVTIPDSVIQIDDQVFRDCASLSSVTIPYSVTSIGKLAFLNCSNLVSVTIPNGVTSIEKETFRGCISLASLSIPESITIIGDAAFRECTSLTSLNIPDSVTTIGDNAFRDCTSLTNISVGLNNPNYSSVDGVLFDKKQTRLLQYPGGKIGDYAIPDSVTTIRSGAFQNCSRLTGVTIPHGVTSVDKETFWGCTGLASVTIPESVIAIGDRAFRECISLTAVTIPNCVTMIGASAFGQCSSLASVAIPPSVNSIGGRAFYACSSLTEIVVDPGNPKYSSVNGVLFNKEQTSLLQYPGGKVGSYAIPESVTAIGLSAFRDCTRLSGVTIPLGVKIGGLALAFNGCSNLTSIAVAPENPYNSSVNGVLFNKDQTELLRVPASTAGAYAVPAGTMTIGRGAFSLCRNLTNVTIPDSVRFIRYDAFENCKNLTEVCFAGVAPDVADNAFVGTHPDLTVYRRPDSIGWGETFGGRPVKVWEGE